MPRGLGDDPLKRKRKSDAPAEADSPQGGSRSPNEVFFKRRPEPESVPAQAATAPEPAVPTPPPIQEAQRVVESPPPVPQPQPAVQAQSENKVGILDRLFGRRQQN